MTKKKTSNTVTPTASTGSAWLSLKELRTTATEHIKNNPESTFTYFHGTTPEFAAKLPVDKKYFFNTKSRARTGFYFVEMNGNGSPLIWIGYQPVESKATANSKANPVVTPAATTPPVASPPLPKLENRWHIVLDASTSMQSLRQAAVNAVNANLDAIRANTTQINNVALTTFAGNYGPKATPIFGYTPVNQVTNFQVNSYQTNGNTPLFDAVGYAVGAARATKNSDAKHVTHVLVVITDGEENDSTEFTGSQIATLMQTLQATDHWTFVYLLPPGAKNRFCRQFSVPEGNVQEWNQTEAGVAQAASQVSQGITQYMANRATGTKATKTFFTTDLSNVKPSDVKASLNDVKNLVHVWTIPAECAVKEFCEKESGAPYKAGNAFYQLTKSEKIHSYKKIFVMNKGSRAVYGGDNARQVLGLPAGEVNVKPGNHSNFDIFVQSTSVNRKLVRGTKLIYVK